MRPIPVKLIVPKYHNSQEGNWSAIYDREDLFFRTPNGKIPKDTTAKRIWIIGDNTDPASSVVDNNFDLAWKLQKSERIGHISYSLYEKTK